MAAAGLDPKAVDMVVISHFHGDHINGLLTADNTLAFPNAEVLVPAAEWKYFMDDGEMSKQTSDRMKGVFANARRVFDAGLKKKVTPYEMARTSRPGCNRWLRSATRRVILRTCCRRAPTSCSSSPMSPTCRRCSSPIPAGT